ncbi:glycosyl hydrolase [Winogradskyella maritima]|uniref:Glycosyl hydrolase n=1 Tax=Winogradskyella maritima TaxID=1517766 RepID=A0ABV8AJX8_9FLAO|nr:glycosyl hydrolase [Winogradskyella maritima]
MRLKFTTLATLLVFLCLAIPVNGQSKTTKDDTNPFDGLELRNIGPAFMSGRIADIAIHPNNEHTWYVAVGSGGVWKTTNAGTTWTPIFDEESVYSIGAVSIDPNRPETIWVGTGEDVGGRHVSFGDGVYRSDNGGKSWTHMGLKDSQHISRVVIHPENSDVIYVTAQGPLWSKGGDRGLYKSTDGGKTWNKTLGDDQWTGVTELVYDPRNPDRMYAATWQRHRTVAAYMGNGPGSALYRSNDAGDTWEKLSNGLPETALGKTGLTISPHNPDVLYAALELDRRQGAVYRSEDGGSSWEKQSNTISGGTGPHYYQELYASPHQEGRLYLMDNNMQISEDGGKTFYRMNSKNKHGDNHAIAFKANDPNYLLVGTDGGLYESFDLTKSWKYIENLPVTQFYKIAVDDATPFYNIYGGTQDNSTEGGPSRTDNIHGIQNSDWRVVLDWDGHQPATEPGNPNIVYAERQEGTLSRLDMKTGESMDIQPQPTDPNAIMRFNWDAPILVSPHKPTTIYFAAQQVWKSENRGDSWTAISDDLTKNEERLALPIMGRQQSWDNAWDVYAMSNYNTITSLSESPKQQGLIYAGTDDGLINISENDGANWRQVNVVQLPDVPSTAFVNDIKADLHDANTVYVALDNHKYGDFKPYLYKSTDKGKSWTSLSSTLPDKHLVWRIVQDHVAPNLLFVGTEFGLFVSTNSGQSWTELQGNVPTISFRDLAIQKRENDLVAGSFGRGIFILDDYTAFRELAGNGSDESSKLFPIRDAWWYIQRGHLGFDADKGSQGDDHFVAPNPEFGALITYYLKDIPKTNAASRKEREEKTKTDLPFPGWNTLELEKLEDKPQVVVVIKNETGDIVRTIYKEAKPGMNRMAWDLRYPNFMPVLLGRDTPMDYVPPQGLLAPPGNYSATLYLSANNTVTQIDEPRTFTVKPLHKNTLEGSNIEEASAFWRSYESTARATNEIDLSIAKFDKKLMALQKAVMNSQMSPEEGLKAINAIKTKLNTLKSTYYGNQAKLEVGEKNPKTVNDMLFTLYLSLGRSTYGPTETNKAQLDMIEGKLMSAKQSVNAINAAIQDLASTIKANGGPYIED